MIEYINPEQKHRTFEKEYGTMSKTYYGFITNGFDNFDASFFCEFEDGSAKPVHVISNNAEIENCTNVGVVREVISIEYDKDTIGTCEGHTPQEFLSFYGDVDTLSIVRLVSEYMAVVKPTTDL